MSIYYYIENLIDFDVNTELEIDEGLVLKLAPKEQQDLINQFVLKFGIVPFDFNLHKYKIEKRLSSGGARLKKRSEDDYRYFVLEHSNTSNYNLFFSRAFLLMEKEFFIPFGFAKGPKNSQIGVSIKYSFEELCAYTYYNDQNIEFKNKVSEVKKFNQNDKAEFLHLMSNLKTFDKKRASFPHISKALDDYFKINEISDNSVFKAVCYIACLELLLVDTAMDKLKSINKQLQTKLNLLNNRFEKPIIVSNHIKGPDTLNLGIVMGIIYNYRSSIAHGDFLDFEKKLKVLEKISSEDILIFLRTILRKTILFAIEEPELIRDLKMC